MQTKISIIILNYKCAKFTDICVAKVLQHAPQDSFEIIVVDNNSHDNILEIQNKYEACKNITWILSPVNLGYGQGNQLGAKLAKGKYILILNPDIEVCENTIQKMVDHMEKETDIGVLGPQLMYPDGTIQDSYRRFPKITDIIIKRTLLKKIRILNKRLKKFLMWNKDPNKTEDVDWVVGACFMVRRDILKDMGSLFDSRFFLFFEDTDTCRRAWEQGWRTVYFPKATATHNHERLSEGGFFNIFRKKTLRIHIISGCKYFLKYAFRSNPRT